MFFDVCLQVQLYFMILERLGKCVEALDVIRGPLGGTNVSVQIKIINMSGVLPVPHV